MSISPHLPGLKSRSAISAEILSTSASLPRFADRAGLPRLSQAVDGVQYLHEEHDAPTRGRWTPPRGVSEYDPVKPGTPPPGYRQTMAPGEQSEGKRYPPTTSASSRDELDSVMAKNCLKAPAPGL